MKRKAKMTFGVCITLGLLASCTEPNPAFDPDPYLPGECRVGVETTETFTQFGRPEKLDVLFLIDTSGEVDGLQELVANSVSLFGTFLEETEVDAQFAVASTSAIDGTLAGPGRRGPDCSGNEKIIADLSDDDWASVLRCNLLIGAGEPAYDEPLHVLDLIVSGSAGDAFPRADARLLVVVASKGDDCSSTEPLSSDPSQGCAGATTLIDPADVVDRWRTRGEALDEIGFVVFGGPPSRLSNESGRPVCSSSIGSVSAANRLSRAAASFDEQGYFFSACTDDITAPLAQALEGYVLNSTVTLCPGDRLAHEPLSVLRTTDDGEEAIRFGDEGFVFLGPTELCDEGALRFAGSALRGAEDVRIDYCTEAGE